MVFNEEIQKEIGGIPTQITPKTTLFIGDRNLVGFSGGFVGTKFSRQRITIILKKWNLFASKFQSKTYRPEKSYKLKTSGNILCGDIQNTIGVDIVGNFYLQ